MSKSSKPVRTRLAPEVRRELILDHAAALIREQGVSALNMDKLGREAGVSKRSFTTIFQTASNS